MIHNSNICVITSGYPIEIDDPNDMTALLVAANVGKVYLYTGTTTQDYINGDLYMVEASS